MIYYSELQGKKVKTEDNIEAGRLEDIVFLASEKPTVTKLVLRGTIEEKLIIPVNYLRKIDKDIVITKDYVNSSLEENELFLVKNLLDKQIIDLKGNKIVRVNDVALQDKNELYIAGVDVGVLGILRWLKLESLLNHILNTFNIKLTPQFLSWGDIQPLELVRGQVKLKKKEERLQRIRPEDLADYLERTNVVNVGKFLRILNEKKAADVIEKLNLNYQVALFRHYKPEKAAKLLTHIEPDDAVDILLTLSTKKRQEILDNLSAENKRELEHLMKYSTTPIGNLLTTEFITVYPDSLAKEVIERVKKETTDFAMLNNVYVVNKQNQLVGVFNLHELLQQNLDIPVYRFMLQNMIFLHLTTPVEIALHRMIKYKLQALPVVDKNKSIIGIVTALKISETVLNKTT